jgi:hypothetical protein
MEGFGVLRLVPFGNLRVLAQDDGLIKTAQDDGLRGGQGGSGLRDNFRRCSWIAALGELGGGEEFSVAGRAVA